MENEENSKSKSVSKRTNTSIQKLDEANTKVSNYFDVDKFNQIEMLVDKLKDSSLASQFIEKKYDKDKDGNIIESSITEVFNKADMIMCLGLGAELGLSPYEALAYGKSLNLTSIKKIRKGEKLGLDYNTALEQIYIWGSGSKEIIYTSIHIVNTVLTKIGVKREIIRDGTKPVYECFHAETGEPVEYSAATCYIIPKNLTGESLSKVLKVVKEDRQLIPVFRDSTPTFYAEIKLSRFNTKLKETETISIPYSSKDAIEAGLYKGVNSKGEEVAGKDNWNNHLATHLRKMSIMNGARIIASDALQGVYLGEEISFIKNSKANDDNIEDIIAEEVN